MLDADSVGVWVIFALYLFLIFLGPDLHRLRAFCDVAEI